VQDKTAAIRSMHRGRRALRAVVFGAPWMPSPRRSARNRTVKGDGILMHNVMALGGAVGGRG
jgi:hypothetical protein